MYVSVLVVERKGLVNGKLRKTTGIMVRMGKGKKRKLTGLRIVKESK